MKFGWMTFAISIISLLVFSKSFHVCISRKSIQPCRNIMKSYSSNNDWVSQNGCEILFPTSQRVPNAIVHFVGGFLAGSVVNIGYSTFLRHLASRGYLVVATPIPLLDLNHGEVANQISNSFSTVYQSYIQSILGPVYSEVPVIAIGHSLGGKLVVLSLSQSNNPQTYAAAIFLSFNNFNAKRSIDFSKEQASKISPELKSLLEIKEVQQLTNAIINSNVKDLLSDILEDTKSRLFFNENNQLGSLLSSQFDSFSDAIKQQTGDKLTQIEFQPTPDETWNIISKTYNTYRNIIFKFDNDNLDQSLELTRILKLKGMEVKFITLPGDHTTPNSVDFDAKNTITFFREIVSQLDRLCDEWWNDSGSFSISSSSSAGRDGRRYLPSGGEEERRNIGLSGRSRSSSDWDNDNF